MTAQREVNAEDIGDTHSTVWRGHGVIALVLLGRHTDVEREALETGVLGE